ncbi:MAG TPA: helix-turn-helix domain-containing protein [Flavobacteriaceae bacterium]|nr:helix-turn-helix domain-containing protein [Flavobacteriaceae bacterium]
MVLISVISGCMVVLVVRYIRNKQKFEVLYKQFIEAQKERNPIPSENNKVVEVILKPSSNSELKEEVILKILKRLEQFEANKEFIKNDLTMAKLAKTMKTNVKYLSRVIQDYKQKDYIRYINDLRIDYLTEMLQSQKYLNYSIEGYAKELGFSSAKGFNRAFEESTGMKFSYFLKKYQKEELEQLAKPA